VERSEDRGRLAVAQPSRYPPSGMAYPPEYDGIHARYYDRANAALRDGADVAFYLGLARETGGPVLEIGCGTGRVLLPIAHTGTRAASGLTAPPRC
jgi:SAM-dependent methyltransferase